jgi:hypothetical protein
MGWRGEAETKSRIGLPGGRTGPATPRPHRHHAIEGSAPDKAIITAEDQVPDPNGLVFSPDYKKFYVISTGKGPGDTGSGGKGEQCRPCGWLQRRDRVDAGRQAHRSYSIRLPEVCGNICFGGPKRNQSIPDWGNYDLAEMPVRAVLDGVTMVTSNGGMVLGHPLNALIWLAETLHKRGSNLRSGEMVLTGTCTGIMKVAAGQTFAGRFADFSPVQIHFV